MIGGSLYGATGDPGDLMSQIAQTPTAEAPPALVTELAVLAGLSILPFVVLLLTSFTKIVIVLSLLRNALGVQQSPPNQVINGIAIIMTIYVMYPTATLMYKEAQGLMANRPQEVLSPDGAQYIASVANQAKEPLRQFLIRNIQPAHVTTFYQLAQKSFGADFKAQLQPQDFIVLIPSYITSQLKGAFEVGVLIYLPFFVLLLNYLLLLSGLANTDRFLRRHLHALGFHPLIFEIL